MAVERIAVAGVGVVTCAGRGTDRTLGALRNGGAHPLPPVGIRSDLPSPPPVFEVPEEALAEPPVRLPGGRGRRAERLALVAALDCAGASLQRLDPERLGVIVGATVGGMNHTEDWVEHETRGGLGHVAVRPAIRHLPLWDVPNALASRIGARGPAFAVATACTSGSQALTVAADLIGTGVCDAVVAGGVDVLARLTYHGFASLGLLDAARCRPFDSARAGLNLGEGAAFLLLVGQGVARRAGLVPIAWLEGWAATADAHHATAPRPDGSGLASAMRNALDIAGAGAGSIDWVHAHGTGTRNNDDVEAEAIASVCGRGAVPVSSTKHVFGHTLGAAGAVSAVVAVLAAKHGFVPGNSPVSSASDAVALVPPGGFRRPVRRVLVNAMGFGGTNCALLLAGAVA